MTEPNIPIPSSPEEQREPEAVAPAPTADKQVLANIETPIGETAGQVNSVLATTQERSPEEVDAILKDKGRKLIVVEDDIEAHAGIMYTLGKKLGEQAKTNLSLAETGEDATKAIDLALQDPQTTKITMILDMEFPMTKEGWKTPGSGLKVLTYARDKVKEHNEQHPDKPVSLEVILNSSMVKSAKDAGRIGIENAPDLKRFSPEKEKAVETLEAYLGNKPLPVPEPPSQRRRLQAQTPTPQ